MDHSLDLLLNLHGTSFTYDCRYWYEIVAYQVEPNSKIPHGIRYSLTFHDHYNQRVYGMDNAHAAPNVGKGNYAGKIYEWDHVHNGLSDRGTAYQFASPEQLMTDFFDAIEKIIKQVS